MTLPGIGTTLSTSWVRYGWRLTRRTRAAHVGSHAGSFFFMPNRADQNIFNTLEGGNRMSGVQTNVGIYDSSVNGSAGHNSAHNFGRRHVVLTSRLGTGLDDIFLDLRNIGWAANVVVQGNGEDTVVDVSVDGVNYSSTTGGAWLQNVEAGTSNTYNMRQGSDIGVGTSWLPDGLMYPFMRFRQRSATASQVTVMLQA